MEISVPEEDKPVIRQLAERLRSGGEVAEKVRAAMASALNPYHGMGLKELLENAPPLDELDIERSKETARDIEL
jgi:hypothetical protein